MQMRVNLGWLYFVILVKSDSTWRDIVHIFIIARVAHDLDIYREIKLNCPH